MGIFLIAREKGIDKAFRKQIIGERIDEEVFDPPFHQTKINLVDIISFFNNKLTLKK